MCAAPLPEKPTENTSQAFSGFISRIGKIAEGLKSLKNKGGESAAKADSVSKPAMESAKDANAVQTKHTFFEKVCGFADKAKTAALHVFKKDSDYTVTEDDSYIKEMFKLQEETLQFGKNLSLDDLKQNHSFSIMDLGKGIQDSFYKVATGVAKLFQATKDKFSELKDIFSGIGSTSYKPVEIEMTEISSNPEPQPAIEKESKSNFEQEDIAEDESFIKEREEQKEIARSVAREVEREQTASQYAKDIDDLINQQLPSPPFKDETQEEAFHSATRELNEKLEQFINEDESIKQKFLKGEKVDLSVRKQEFSQLISNYNEQVKKFS